MDPYGYQQDWNGPMPHYDWRQQYVPWNYYWNPNYYPPYENNRPRDYGGRPYIENMEEVTERNRAFRRALWTGKYLQVTLMNIGRGEEIGLEIHPNTDQFLNIAEGQGLVEMGRRRDQLNFRERVSEGDAIMVPAGTWHNIRNTSNRPLKLYSIYAPPEHPFGTIQQEKGDNGNY